MQKTTMGETAVNKKLLRAGMAAGCAALIAGCYVVPLQSEAGQQPVYAYTSQIPPQAVRPVLPGPALPSSLYVRLYPVNDAAAQQGALQGTVADSQTGHGTFTLYVAGEQLQGEATRVPDNYPGFGRVFREVLGGQPSTAAGSRKGIANAYGGRGMHANCEYVLSAAATGTGVCAFSNGAKYQLHFGS
ncbi:MAG: hypothetical protein ABIS45_08515 [Burkholderiales bacterium]